MDQTVFQRHRARFIEQMTDRSAALSTAGDAAPQDGRPVYPYETNRNFLYLTGLSKPNMNLVLLKDQGRTFELLFIEETSDYINKWLGAPDVEGRSRRRIRNRREERPYVTEFREFVATSLSNNRQRARPETRPSLPRPVPPEGRISKPSR
ncbi:MAG: aminopeptidase P N-terminal domain-containing protein [Bacillus subtilis]|nr:aminopeptidase P N-terminal domain-containing protein [Bacillus subtilis]